MNIIKKILIIGLLSASSAFAAPASESSVRQLLTVTQAQKLLEGIKGQFDALMNNAIQESLQGLTPNAKQQQAIDNMKKKTVALMQEELAWQKLEPMYIRLYKESFTEEEVAGMLAFYKTPAGRAVIKKTPMLMQKIMQDMQQSIVGMAPKMQEIQQSFIAEMSAASQ